MNLLNKKQTQLIITNPDHPDLLVTKIQLKTLKEMSGSVEMKIHGDINEPILSGYDEW